ncbi:MAG: hypothetical protein PVH19_04500 [Planctomycetia bacterium]
MEENKTNGDLLDKIQRQKVCAILALGCSRRVAARYVGCRFSLIRATMSRDESFRQEIERAEQISEIEYIQNIKEAAKKSQYWRAAAWALERCNPDDYAFHDPTTFTMDQIRQLLDQFIEIIVQEIPAATQRKRLLYGLKKLTTQFESDNKK